MSFISNIAAMMLCMVLLIACGGTGHVRADHAAAVSRHAAPASEEIGATLAHHFKPGRPGATVIVTQGGETVFRKAYGMADLERGVALQPDMSLRLGSITKQFTAAAIMLLADQGKLALTDDIRTHLPDYPAHATPITIEHLLTHTSGIRSFTAMPRFGAIAGSERSVHQMIEFFQDEALEFPPGQRFSYSNSGYFLLGAIIEEVSGMTYADFMEKHIFAPLHLHSTFYDSNERIDERQADGYTKNRGRIEKASFISLSIPYAAGALRSSVDDLARWNEAITAGKLLKPASWQRMFTPYTLAGGKSAGYGYGWFIRKVHGHDALEHGGSINGFSGDTLRLPGQAIFIAVLTNSDTPEADAQELTKKIATILLP